LEKEENTLKAGRNTRVDESTIKKNRDRFKKANKYTITAIKIKPKA